jgi:putative oligomerization/nucleic acid binding protein
MAGGRTVPRIFILASVVTLVVAVVGFIVTMVLNAFVLDEYDAYGEVPIPGSSSLHLPAGEATISFHTQTIGSPSGGGLPVPNLGLTIVPPAGIPKPEVTQNWGTTTTVNNDARVRVWVVQIPADGTYQITADGNVNGYINPQLAFGHDSSNATLVWAFVGLFVVGLLELTAAIIYAVRSGKRPVPAAPVGPTFDIGDSYRVADRYTPTDDGVRIEQLKNLAALRDSGALTDQEFEAEKHRILNS